MVSLPTEWIDGRVARPERLSGAILRDHPLARLWASHLANGFALADELSPSAASLFARHSVELLAQALEEAPGDRPTPSDAWRVGIYLRARQVIALRFCQPALTPDLIARDLRISTRTLARIFAERGETVMRCVLAERVRWAAKLLASPRAVSRSVTDIALACGFNDSSHFGRVFAAQLHVTPSEWRRRNEGQSRGPQKPPNGSFTGQENNNRAATMRWSSADACSSRWVAFNDGKGALAVALASAGERPLSVQVTDLRGCAWERALCAETGHRRIIGKIIGDHKIVGDQL